MADLFNQQISATYSGLLKTSSSGVLSASLSQISDGRGNTSPLYLSTGSIQFYGAYSFPNADGSANQVLKTDGAGVLTWENDSLSNTLNFSGGTGTGSVTLDSQTLAFTGTANEIVTSASSQSITLSFPTAGVTLPDGSIATTQTASDNSTKVATTAYVDNQVSTAGTVTSVALSVPTGLTVTGSPITTSGTIAIANTSGYSIPTDAKQTQWDTAYTNRITTATSPLSITTNTISLNTVPVSNGGTGATTLTGILLGNGTSAISAVTDGTVGQVLSTDGSGTYSFIDAATGDVSISGTPATNQIAIWTNATTIKGDATFTIDTSGGIYLSQTLNSYNIGGGKIATVTGTNNTGFGKNNLSALASGFNNVAIGYESSQDITTGHRNVSVGSQSLSSAQGATDNTAVGEGALYTNISGDKNVAIGRDALRFFTGGNNTSIGMQSLFGVSGTSTGTGNTAIGYNSGSAITTGSNNVIIGSNTGSTIATSSNNIIISDGGGNIRQSFDINGAATFVGDVGIGTDSPDARFSVVSSSPNSTAARIGGIEYGGSQRGLTIKTFQSLGGDDCGVEFNAAEGLATYGSFVFKADTAELMRISSGGDVTASNKKNSSNFTDKTTTPYAEEKIYKLFVGGGTTTVDICTITSAYSNGSFMVECNIAGQWAGNDTRTGSYKKALISLYSGGLNEVSIDQVNGAFTGTINYTYVTNGVLKINLTSMNNVGSFNGIAYVRVIGGNNSNTNNVTPLGFTLS
jgi:hypothetical protein